MLSLRQSLAQIGKTPPIRIPGDVEMPCKSLRDTLTFWNHTPCALLIIAPQEFVKEMQPLANHKNNTGIITTVLSLKHIYKAYSGRDEAEKVKRCLALFKTNNYIQYAMLVGDEDMFPVRFTKWYYRRGEPGTTEYTNNPEFDTVFIPVDLYYAALFKPDGSFDDWDGNQNGYYGEIPAPWSSDAINIDEVSVIPDIAVGRIPASTKGEIAHYVNKVINYESYAYGSSWAKAALFVEGDWMPDAHLELNTIESSYLQGYNVYKLYSSGGTDNPCPEKINSYMDPPNGVGFVIYVGHGNTDEWVIKSSSPYISYSINDLNNLSNSDRQPVVFAMACDTARFANLPPLAAYRDVYGNAHQGTTNGEVFDSYPPQPACLQIHDKESMAEYATVMNDSGAIIYIGCIVNAQTPTYDLLNPFFKEVTSCKTSGDAWLLAIQTYYQKNPPEPDAPANVVMPVQIVPWKFLLFGDPSLRVGGISP